MCVYMCKVCLKVCLADVCVSPDIHNTFVSQQYMYSYVYTHNIVFKYNFKHTDKHTLLSRWGIVCVTQLQVCVFKSVSHTQYLYCHK